MKKILILLLLLTNLSIVNAQGLLKSINKALKKDTSSNILSGLGKSNSLSNDEIISGLKEALRVATDSSSSILSKTDGYFGNAAIKILMPEEAKKAERTLQSMGMSSLVDKAILSMNRAAEDAASGVGQIFWTAIKQMT